MIKLANLAAEQLTCFTKEELRHFKITQIIPESHQEKHADFIKNFSTNIRLQNKTATTEMLVQNKQGKRIPVEINISPITIGNEVLIYTSIRDITERKQEKAEIQNLFAQINQATEAIFIVDETFTIKSWNKGAEVLFGYKKEEAIGNNSLSLLQKNVHQEQIDTINIAIDKTGFWSGEVKKKNKSGEELYVYSSFSRVKNNESKKNNFVCVSFDLSPLKKLEQQVNHLANIVEYSSEAILSRDINGKVISWNKGAESMFGFTREEMIGNTMEALGLCRNPEEAAAIDQKIKKEGASFTEKEYYHKKGYKITGALTANATYDENQSISGIICIIKDITLRKNFEAQLMLNNAALEDKVKQRTVEIRKSEAKYKLLYKNNPMPMWVYNTKTLEILDVNTAAELKYGYTKEEFLKLTLLDIRPEEDRELLLKFDHTYLNAESCIYNGIWRHKKKDGTPIIIEVINHPVNFEGINARLTLLNDVTEKVEIQNKLAVSEKRFRTLIENSYEIITLLDKEFKVVYRSPSGYRITGRPDEEVLGIDGKLRIHPDDIQLVADKIKSLYSKPGTSEDCIFRYLHKNGNYLWMEGNATNLLHDENIQAIVLNYRDVTERINAEAEVAANEKRFRSLIENGVDIINLLDENFNVIYRSPSAIRTSQLSNSDILGVDGRKRIHQDDLPLLGEGIQRLLQKPGYSELTRFRFKHNDGHYLWFEGTVTNLLQDEAVKAIVFNYREVTERIEAAQKVKLSEERYRKTLDSMIEGVQIIGFDWKYKYLNDAAVKQSRHNKEELLGHTLKEKYPGIEQTELYRQIEKCFKERTVIQFENKFTYPDGVNAWFELSIQPVDEGIFILSVDVTEKVKVAAALKSERDKVAHIAATSPGLLYSFKIKKDGSFHFPYTSQAAEDIFGIKKEILKDNINPLLQNAVNDDINKILNSITESLNNMSPWKLQFRYCHPVKGVVWLDGHSIPSKEADGSTIWHGIITDVTDRKKAEEKIMQQSAQLKTLSDNLPGIMIYQLGGDNYENRKFTYVSNEVTRFTGRTPEEVLDDPDIIYNQILPEDLPMLLEAEKKSYEYSIKFNQEVRCQNYKGEVRWLQIISNPRKTNEGKIVWDGFHIDITERKKDEAEIHKSYLEKRVLAERLSTILNTLPANIALIDGNGIIADVNLSWMEFAGKNKWSANSYGIGSNYITLTSKLLNLDYYESQKIAEGIKSVLNKTSIQYVHEYFYINENIKSWFRMIVSPLPGDAENGAVVMHIDVSEIKRLEEDRMRSEAAQQKKITAAIIEGQENERNAIGKELHDNINQILAGVNILLGLINKRPERLEELLPVCINHMTLAINENRKMAHKLVSPNDENADLIELIQRTTDSMLVTADINVKIACNNFDEALLTDYQKLAIYRIIQEQCTNIIKYANTKKVMLLLHTGTKRFLLIIKDYGCGMEKTKKTAGIGLQNIKSRVNLLNGTVTITTKPNAGFMLAVDIPITKSTKVLLEAAVG
jgi:PAS domain S-box-containing protein